MKEEAAAWHPPNARELIEKGLSNGSHWYELRMPLKTLSFPVERWDDALNDVQAFRKVLGSKAALYYCYKENNKLSAVKVL